VEFKLYRAKMASHGKINYEVLLVTNSRSIHEFTLETALCMQDFEMRMLTKTPLHEHVSLNVSSIYQQTINADSISEQYEYILILFLVTTGC